MAEETGARDALLETIEEIEVDPVCGATVELDDAEERGHALVYEGRSYTFCGSECRARFEHEPDRYSAAGRSQP